MGTRITEFFGHEIGDAAAESYVASKMCPFVNAPCVKPDHGACSLEAQEDPKPVICCPNRLYANKFTLLRHVSDLAFGPNRKIITPADAKSRIKRGNLTGDEVVAFGRYFGQELPLPRVGSSSGSYYMDWVLATLDNEGKVEELTALEVQTIDTTGSYREQSNAAFKGDLFTDKQGRRPGYSSAGFNWENVNKRILPQVIYKGHVLRLEKRSTKGFFFACPKAVYDRIIDRLGGAGQLRAYAMHQGSITFLSYDLEQKLPNKRIRGLVGPTAFTTTIDQVALAFTSPRNLPPAGCYETAANASLRD